MINALIHRDYRVFFTGSMVTRIGEDMQEVAEDWLVFVMTGSPFLLGLVAFCKGAFTGPAGADLWRRR
jgi:hypothetical protein